MNEPSMVEQPKAEVKTTSRKSPRGQVTVFANWCKGCGICVAFCPTDVLALDHDDHPVVVYPERCTACHWCDTHCPDLAIIVKKIS
jgi:2-oxoglutarate ferredoxin oxidoreductase subunit delta